MVCERTTRLLSEKKVWTVFMKRRLITKIVKQRYFWEEGGKEKFIFDTSFNTAVFERRGRGQFPSHWLKLAPPPLALGTEVLYGFCHFLLFYCRFYCLLMYFVYNINFKQTK